jgi:hypothetical protein
VARAIARAQYTFEEVHLESGVREEAPMIAQRRIRAALRKRVARAKHGAGEQL